MKLFYRSITSEPQADAFGRAEYITSGDESPSRADFRSGSIASL
jgi:hypothetical protein